jgi:hypothetical protein
MLKQLLCTMATVGISIMPLATQAQAEALSAATIQGAYADFGDHAPKESGAGLITLTLNYPLFWNIKPVVGAAGFTVGNIYGFAGFERLFEWRNITLTPQVAVGAYHRFSSRGDLGSNMIFRQELTLGYRVTPNVVLGISAGHLSNAGLDARNPGVNTFGLSLRQEF